MPYTAGTHSNAVTVHCKYHKTLVCTCSDTHACLHALKMKIKGLCYMYIYTERERDEIPSQFMLCNLACGVEELFEIKTTVSALYWIIMPGTDGTSTVMHLHVEVPLQVNVDTFSIHIRAHMPMYSSNAVTSSCKHILHTYIYMHTLNVLKQCCHKYIAVSIFTIHMCAHTEQ